LRRPKPEETTNGPEEDVEAVRRWWSETVERHLDQVDAVHPGRLRVPEQLLGGERSRLHVLFLVAFRQRVVLRVRRPDVDVRVDEVPFVLGVRRWDFGSSYQQAEARGADRADFREIALDPHVA
jgi:hypothetical protein